MGKLIFHSERIKDKQEFIKVCPFGAMEIKDGAVTVNAACKMCKLCVKRSANGEAEFEEDVSPKADLSAYSGICVYVDHIEGKIHPVTYELLGKARELALKSNQQVYALFMGDGIKDKAEELTHYGADRVFVYDKNELRDFRAEVYASVFEDFINKYRPSTVLVGASPVGRLLAPRVAARMNTGLTADCTVLDMDEDGSLSQIRPAFGGNIMAHIMTPNHRPQMATVRYKIMNAAPRDDGAHGEITLCEIGSDRLISGIEILSVTKKPVVKSIEQAEIIVAAGRGIKSKADMSMIFELASALGGEVAGTRPMIEAGIIEPRRQVGLSGRTVRPKLFVACGISGAVQFTAGMNGSEHIIAINSDPDAPIFKTAHIGLVGDIYEIVPKLTEIIRKRGNR